MIRWIDGVHVRPSSVSSTLCHPREWAMADEEDSQGLYEWSAVTTEKMTKCWVLLRIEQVMRRSCNKLVVLSCLLFVVLAVYSFVKLGPPLRKYREGTRSIGGESPTPKQGKSHDSNLQSTIIDLKALNKTLLVTVINDAYMPFAHNWLCNTMYMNIHEQVLVVAMDEKSRDEITTIWPRVHVISLPGDSFHGDQNYSRAGYVRIMVRRTELILQLLKQDIEMLLFDLDTFWKTDPIPLCQSQAHGYDIAVVPVSNNPGTICGGFIYMKPTVNMLHLWTKLTEMMLALGKRIKSLDDKKPVSEGHNDQTYISSLLRKKYSGIKSKRLSLKDFPDGLWYKMKESEQDKLSPLVIHNNWIIGNTAKMNRAKQFHQWFWNAENKRCDVDMVILKTQS